MIRRILIGCMLLAGVVQLSTAQSAAKATQVVTFSVRTTQTTLIAGAMHNPLPADLKVTAALDGTSNAPGARAVDVRTIDAVASKVFTQEQTVILTVTQ